MSHPCPEHLTVQSAVGLDPIQLLRERDEARAALAHYSAALGMLASEIGRAVYGGPEIADHYLALAEGKNHDALGCPRCHELRAAVSACHPASRAEGSGT